MATQEVNSPIGPGSGVREVTRGHAFAASRSANARPGPADHSACGSPLSTSRAPSGTASTSVAASSTDSWGASSTASRSSGRLPSAARPPASRPATVSAPSSPIPGTAASRRLPLSV